MKLWGGRFQKETDELVNDFNASIHFDQRLYKEDITGSMAHAKMLGACGIISGEDTEAIVKGLADILADVEAGKVEFTADNEDIHMNVESLLTARIGQAGKRLHTARSRNDQVALDFRMYVRTQIGVIVEQLLELETVLCRQAAKYQTAVMPSSGPSPSPLHSISWPTAPCSAGTCSAWRTAPPGSTSAPWAAAPWRAPPIPSTAL